jgi:hypothetical protein
MQKEEYLDSLPTYRLKILRDQWKDIWLKRPNYWIAETEYKLLDAIIRAREHKQTWTISPDTL